MYYTYVWLRKDGTPYYVGKGTGKRAYVKETHRFNPPPVGRTVFYIAKDEADAFETEIALIWYYGRKDLGVGCLRNLTDGGENPPRQKVPPMLGKKHSEETKSLMSLACIGNQRAKGSKGRLGIKQSPETIEKLRNLRLSDEHKALISKAMKGKPWSEARRQAQLCR